jgi:uncharacterized protein
MLMVVSPAKSLDFDTPHAPMNSKMPQFLEHSSQLIDQLKLHEPDYFQTLMKISPKLAQLNWQRFQDWRMPFTQENARPAVFAFTGDVYQGLDVHSLNEDQLNVCDQKLRILSGLYGLLKPSDLMQAYRLEMGTKYANEKGKNLYEFWGNKITHQLNEDLAGQVLVNLASNEYFKAVQVKALHSAVITPVFKDQKNGKYKIISFFAKRARGFMARYIIEHNLTQPEQLKAFDVAGYEFCAEESGASTYVFKRLEGVS